MEVCPSAPRVDAAEAPGLEDQPKVQADARGYSIDTIKRAFCSTDIQAQKMLRGAAQKVPNRMIHMLDAVDEHVQDTAIQVGDAQLAYFSSLATSISISK